jgi:hypothetical protein
MKDKTVKETFESLNDDQKALLKFMVGEALEEGIRRGIAMARHKADVMGFWDTFVAKYVYKP